MNTHPLISNIQKFSVRDGPGIRSVVFFKGCPLRCQWCANPENINPGKELMFHQVKCIGCGRCVKACTNRAIEASDSGLIYKKEKCVLCGDCVKECFTKAREMKGEELSAAEVISDIDSDIPFYRTSGGGVTFSGGEPLLYPDFVKAVADDYKNKGFNTAVETCGCVPWENIKTVLGSIDLFLYDIKMIDEEQHIKWCGRSNAGILANLMKLTESDRNVIARIPVIPGINDGDNIEKTGEFLGQIVNKLSEVHILPYHNFGISKYVDLGIAYNLTQINVPEAEHMNSIKQRLEKYGLTVKVGG